LIPPDLSGRKGPKRGVPWAWDSILDPRSGRC